MDAVAEPSSELSTSDPPHAGRRIGKNERRFLSWPAALLGCAIAGVLLAAFITTQCLHTPVSWFNAGADRLEKWAPRVRDAFLGAMQVQPRVTINDRVVFEQASPALELAVIERPTLVEREFTATFLGSSKRVRLRGEFVVKAGFDLRQPFSARLDRNDASATTSGRRDEPTLVRVSMPAARILGVESKKIEVLELTNGLWNRVKPGDLQGEINALTEQARSKAEGASLAREAESALTAQLRERLGNDCRLEIQFGDAAPTRPTGAEPGR